MKSRKTQGQNKQKMQKTDLFLMFDTALQLGLKVKKRKRKKKKEEKKEEEMHTSTKKIFCMNVQALLQLTVQQCDLYYHTSAILAAALDTMTMPFRQETGPIHLSDVTSALSPLGRKVSLPLLVV